VVKRFNPPAEPVILIDEPVNLSACAIAVPRSLTESPEQFAICDFFSQFILVPLHPDGQRGFLDCLLPLYITTRYDSLLSVATTAVALAVSGGTPWRRADFHLGRVVFGKALRMAATIIQDPIAAMEDETLMAVLLMGFYEVRTDSSTDSGLIVSVRMESSRPANAGLGGI
jgi:hypothetical protein